MYLGIKCSLNFLFLLLIKLLDQIFYILFLNIQFC